MDTTEKTTASEPVADSRSDNAPPDELMEQMYYPLHEYRCGRLKFLELLERWKKILHLPPSANK